MNYLVCSDLEGVFIPEVWINVAEKTGVQELRLTTRDIPDYSELMTKRLAILRKHGLKLQDIQDVIAGMQPLDGAMDFIEWIKEKAPFHIVSDTFMEFSDPLMAQLGRPSLFCNSLVVSSSGVIEDFVLRQPDQKRAVVKAFKSLQYRVLAFGDSYNDISMLQESDTGFLFKPSASVMKDYPEFSVAHHYDALKQLLLPYFSNH